MISTQTRAVCSNLDKEADGTAKAAGSTQQARRPRGASGWTNHRSARREAGDGPAVGAHEGARRRPEAAAQAPSARAARGATRTAGRESRGGGEKDYPPPPP